MEKSSSLQVINSTFYTFKHQKIEQNAMQTKQCIFYQAKSFKKTILEYVTV